MTCLMPRSTERRRLAGGFSSSVFGREQGMKRFQSRVRTCSTLCSHPPWRTDSPGDGGLSIQLGRPTQPDHDAGYTRAYRTSLCWVHESRKSRVLMRRPPRPSSSGLMREGAPKHLSNTQTPAVLRETVMRLQQIPPGGCARDIPAHLLNGLSRRFDSAYRRLHPNAPSTALSTKYDCLYHYAGERSLSVREYARIQGLPDFVTFPEAWRAAAAPTR